MHSLDTVGHIAAMAGRSMPGSVFRQNFAIAIKAPVLPADTVALACPSLTAWIASHMPLFQRPLRRAWLGLASMGIETSV